MHWDMPPETLRRLIPSSLEIDTFNGRSWIGIVPFRMSGVRVRGTPPVPGLSAFPELNVRTYVTKDGKPGVWFFSLDAASLLTVWGARGWLRLPYFHAQMKSQEVEGKIFYHSRRRGGLNAVFEAHYQPSGSVSDPKPGTLDHWLTERYCLYGATRTQAVYRMEIHHAPWALQPAQSVVFRNTMTGPLGIQLPHQEPLLHFARRQDVFIWPPE